MKSSNYLLYYKQVRSLFPSIGFKEGKFLRELKYHLRDFCLSYPNSTYEDIVEFFGAPEEIIKGYVETEGIQTITKRATIRKYIHICVYIIIAVLFFFVCNIFGSLD